MALLIAVLNVGLFLESTSDGVPLLTIVGTALSWLVLAVWWQRSDGSAIVPALIVMAGFALLTLGGSAWARSRSEVLGVVVVVLLLLIARLVRSGPPAADATWQSPDSNRLIRITTETPDNRRVLPRSAPCARHQPPRQEMHVVVFDVASSTIARSGQPEA